MKLSALTIERSPARHSLLTELLQEFDFPVVVPALSPLNGRELMRHMTFDVIFIEVERGVDPGFDFVRQVRVGDVATRQTPIIVMSTESAPSMVSKARDAGANGFLAKPFSRASVGLQVARALNHRRLFIVTPTFAGPDRRRWDDPLYGGPERRANKREMLID